jgi:S-methylmethionine-dependent homocysteine/selenocysteine methylase
VGTIEKKERATMSLYRDGLPQLSNGVFLTDGGLETDLIFHQGVELPCLAAYVLLEDEAGVERLARYFADYLAIAHELGTGFVLESPTWRASRGWASKIGTPLEALPSLNRKAIEMLAILRDQYASEVAPIVISGCLGSRFDAYRPEDSMSEHEAARYHRNQIATFSDTEADMVTALTLTNVPEAVAIARVAQEAELPTAISFTVETDGRLPTGPTLREAIEQVDDATDGTPAYYMINCAYPTHFEPALAPGEGWTERIRGLRANSSSKSHAELDDSPGLDEGNPAELGARYRSLLERLPHIRVLGGCCGTDARHIRQIAEACVPH